MQYELSVSCENLKDTDILSKSDPMLLLLQRVPNSKKYLELGRTEVIKDCLFPEFAQKFRITASAEGEDREFRVAIVDIDDFERVDDLSKQEFIGRAEFQESDLLKSHELKLQLTGHAGEVKLKSVEYKQQHDGRVQLQLTNGNFELNDRCAFLEIHRADQPISEQQQLEEEEEQKDFTLVYRSEQAVNANFQPISISLFSLSLGNEQQPLRFSCWQRGSRGNHKQLGSCATSLAELLNAFNTEPSPVIMFNHQDGDVSFLRIQQISVQS